MPESVTDRPTRAHEYIFLLSKSPKYYYDHEAIRETPSLALVKQVEEGYNGHAIKDYLKMGVQDASATKSRIISNARKRIDKQRGHSRRHAGFNDKWDALTPAEQALLGRNKRSVWTVAPANFAESHFATFPTKLIEPCILAGSKAGDVVLDPFAGSGTTGEVALTLGRKAVLIELNPDYIKMIEKRCTIQPGFPFAA
jgi:DNA modification methylase